MRHRMAAQCAFALLIAAGIALRCLQYLHAREFWPDEAYLALDIAHFSYRELAGQLHYNMVFPLGFLFATKAIIAAFGTSEYAFRLIAFACGLGSMLLFTGLAIHLARTGVARQIDWASALTALAFFALSKHLIYYSSELRHYAIDLAAACFVYFLAFAPPVGDHEEALSARRSLAISLIGATLVWFSLTTAFVLASVAAVAIGLAALRGQWRAALRYSIHCAIWAASLCVHLFLLNRAMALGARTSTIHAHVASLSLPFPPTTFMELRLWRDAAEHFVYFPGGLALATLAGVVCLIGVLAQWRRNRAQLFMLLLPALFALAASALHHYPFRNQYLLFLTPAFCLILASGIAFLLNQPDRILRVTGAALLILLMAHPTAEGARIFAGKYRSGPGGDSIIKPLLAQIESRWEKDDLLIVTETQTPMFRCYAQQFGFVEHRATEGPDPILYVRRDAAPREQQETNRIWLLESTRDTAPDAQPTITVGRRLDETRTESAVLHLYEALPESHATVALSQEGKTP